MTFDELWTRFLGRMRHVDEGTHKLYEGYGRNHLLPFFGGTDIGLILRTRPLRAADAWADALYVDDDWVTGMLKKERRNNAGRPIAGSLLSMKFVDNVLTVLGQCFDLAVVERPALLAVNPAKEIRLPKHDRREMHFLDDAAAYAALRGAMNPHFQPVLDFLVGTGAPYGEAAGLWVQHLRLDAARPYVDIRAALKWTGKRRKRGRPKTRSSIRRILLPPRLVKVLRPLVFGKGPEDFVFTMLEGGLHPSWADSSATGSKGHQRDHASSDLVLARLRKVTSPIRSARERLDEVVHRHLRHDRWSLGSRGTRVRISRLLLHDFRGWSDLDLRPRAHVLLAGVPRAGRSDISLALARPLDPAFIRVQPTLADIRQHRSPAATSGLPGPGAGSTPVPSTEGQPAVSRAAVTPAAAHTAAAYGEVEATLVDLDPELEQLCDGFLEPLDEEGQVDETGNAAPDAPLGLRLSYRVSYDSPTDSLEHVVFFPVRSNPTTLSSTHARQWRPREGRPSPTALRSMRLTAAR